MFGLYLEVGALHPGHEGVDESASVLALDAVIDQIHCNDVLKYFQYLN